MGMKQAGIGMALLFVFALSCHAAVPEAVVTDAAYGAVADDGADDTAAFAKALADVAVNGRVVVPAGRFHVSMKDGLTLNTEGVSVVVRGAITAVAKGLAPTDAKSLFTVTAPGCRFLGEGGMFVGDGWLFTGAIPERTTYAAFVRAPGAFDIEIRGLRFRDAPGTIIRLLGSRDSAIRDCVFEGGTAPVTDEKARPFSYYFGITFRGVDGLLIQGNHFRLYQGRAAYQWITSSSTSHSQHVSIVGNVFEGGYDHCVYCSGIHHSVCANNVTRNTHGSALKLIGWDLAITGNNCFNAPGGGIEARSSSRSVVANNVITNYGHVAIELTRYGGFKGDFEDNIVEGNMCIGNAELKDQVYCGVRIISEGRVSRCKVVNNTIAHSGRADYPAIQILGGARSDGVIVSGNTIRKCVGPGIQLRNVHNSIVRGNFVQGTESTLDLGEGKGLVVSDNIVRKLR